MAPIEITLEDLIRRKLKRRDDETWELLTAQNGPLDTFSSKINLGYALGIYKDEVRENLHIIRTIRNAFAHSRKIIDFSHPLITAELRKVKLPKAKSNYMHKSLASFKSYIESDHYSFMILGYVMHSTLLKHSNRSSTASIRNYQRKSRAMEKLIGKYTKGPFGGTLGTLGILSMFDATKE